MIAPTPHFRHPSTPPAGQRPTPDMLLGLPGFRFRDLFDPARLRDLDEAFRARLAETDPATHALYTAYRAARGEGMGPEDVSRALLATAPHVSSFVIELFDTTAAATQLRAEVGGRAALFRFKRDFAKKRVLKEGAGKGWSASVEEARVVCEAALEVTLPDAHTRRLDEELTVSRGVLSALEVDEVARKAAKSGGARWTDDLHARARALRGALAALPCARSAVACVDPSSPSEAEDGRIAAFVLDAFEAWITARRRDHHDQAHRWPSLRAPRTLDFANLVELRRPDRALPELFVGPEEHRRERDGFALTDRRMSPRDVEQEIDYCLFCHDRDKDSCSKGLRDAKTRELKKNPLGVTLAGCPLGEKISEMHVLRRDGDALAALALVCVDNPMCPGTGHRICNDCMKACVFQKQEPVNIPQVETRVLTEVLSLPFGLEMYGLLTRWNPLDVRRPFNLPYNGRNVLVVGLGPAGYTLCHHLVREGFSVTAVDGLKIEPLPADLVGDGTSPPWPVEDFGTLYREIDERLLLGFGGVSEYGITARWDKNFLTLLYVTLARNALLRIHGGVRFGGTLTLDDARALGFDHVAIAAGAGRPTIIDMENNLARGIRKASDFLMALQLTGAYKRSSIANLQVSLPAIVIGGGLTAIDTATEILAYYPVQIEKTLGRYTELVRARGEVAVRAMFDEEEWEELTTQLGHARELDAERSAAAREGRDPRLQPLLARWGGATIVYRKSLADSPAYRLNHEEVHESLQEGVRYVEGLSPVTAILDARRHVRAMRFRRADGSELELPARTVCVAAGTSPNVTYEREHKGTFQLDRRGQYFQPHTASVDATSGDLTVTPAAAGDDGAFFTNHAEGKLAVSFYGDNHPHYAGSVVKAMASAKDGFRHVAALFPEIQRLDAAAQPERELALRAHQARLEHLLTAKVVEVNRLTASIVEVVVQAPLAARKFEPGQFYRLQNYEALAPVVDGTRLAMEGLALTGAWIDEEKGLLGTIVLEMGGSSRLCAALAPGERVVLMGPTGTPTEIAKETVLLCGGGLGNAVLFSIARAFKALGATVIYVAGYKRGEDLFKQDDIEAHTDQVVWASDSGAEIQPRRPQDAYFRGNVVDALVAYGEGRLGRPVVKLSEVKRILAIGSDRMMAAVRDARHGVLAPMLDPRHLAIGSINSPMQCMMKEVCAQCLQKHRDPRTGEERVVFSCYNQDQELDAVDFRHLSERLRANSMQEKISNAWLDHLLAKNPTLLRI